MARNVKYYASASERAEALETVIFELGEAIEALDGIAGYENTVDTLTDIQDEMQRELELANADIYADQVEQYREMNREYYRSVM